MKWFFALSANTLTFPSYSELVKVAVLSARRHTSLEPNFLYNSPVEDALVQWLKKHDVVIWYRPSFLENELKHIAVTQNKPSVFSIGSGAFLRCEIPTLVHENTPDKFVLYTDCDIMFLNDVADLANCHPQYFAVAPEFKKYDYRHANTGVMIMNIDGLYQENSAFQKYVLQNLNKLVSKSWDQTAYLDYYKTGFLSRRPLWDKLPIEYNWKTYWGDYSNARIVHFHGLKPFHRELVIQRKLPPKMLKLESPEYHVLTETYYKWLSKA